MPTEIVTIDPAHPETAFARCREVIRSGGVVAYPTDTFYGLGVDPGNPAAVRKLFLLKARPDDQPILILISDQAAVRAWAVDISTQAEDLMKRFWPGPLTLVFKAQQEVLPELTAGSGRIGLRVPGNETTRQLLAFLGTALTGTSANRSGGQSARTAAEAAEEFGDSIDLVLDSGSAAATMPSTVVDVTGTTLKVIREGAVPSREIIK